MSHRLPEHSEPSNRRGLLTILFLALLLRLATACVLQYLLDYRWHRSFLIEGDAEGYWLLAQQITTGGDFAIYSPPRYALRMPGFPALLAIPVALFGANLFAARLFLAGVGTIACWLTYRLGKRLYSEKVGLIGAALSAVSPVLIVFTETILSETAFAVTLLWSLLAGTRLRDLLLVANAPRQSGLFRARLLWAMWTGLAIAAGVMMRPSWILAAPILAVLLVFTIPKNIGAGRVQAGIYGGLVTVFMVLALLPWGIRNQLVTGHFKLTTFWMGPSLYDGLNPTATGDSNMEFYTKDNLMLKMSEYEVDQHYQQAAKRFLFENPGRAAELAVIKLGRYWSPTPNADQFNQWVVKIPVAGFWILVLLAAMVGTRAAFIRSGTAGEAAGPAPILAAIWSMAILTGPIFYFAAIHMFFVSSLRYRLPAEYPLLILSAFGMIWLWERWRVRGA